MRFTKVLTTDKKNSVYEREAFYFMCARKLRWLDEAVVLATKGYFTFFFCSLRWKEISVEVECNRKLVFFKNSAPYFWIFCPKPNILQKVETFSFFPNFCLFRDQQALPVSENTFFCFLSSKRFDLAQKFDWSKKCDTP